MIEQDTTYLNNPDNQQEGENVQDFKKDFGGLINFNTTTLEGNTQPVSLFGFSEEDQTTYPYSNRWISRARDISNKNYPISIWPQTSASCK